MDIFPKYVYNNDKMLFLYGKELSITTYMTYSCVLSVIIAQIFGKVTEICFFKLNKIKTHFSLNCGEDDLETYFKNLLIKFDFDFL